MCHAHAKLTHKFAKYKNPSWSGWAFSEHLYSWQLVSDKYKLSVQDLSIARAQNKRPATMDKSLGDKLAFSLFQAAR